jgi:hypothetical protein
MMSKKETLKNLHETLSEALHDAHHQTYIGNKRKAQEFLKVADKTLEAIRQLT